MSLNSKDTSGEFDQKLDELYENQRGMLEIKDVLDLLNGMKNDQGEVVETIEEVEVLTCSICDNDIEHEISPNGNVWNLGHNAEPIRHDQRCCTKCNDDVVIPTRMVINQLINNRIEIGSK